MNKAFITGANKGIGFATAKQLLEKGYYVFLGSRDLKKGVKDHLPYVTLSMFIIGLSYYIFHMIVRQGYFLEDSLKITIQVVLSLILLVTSVMMSIFVISQTTLYKLSLYAIYKNSLLFMMRYFFQTLGLILLLFLSWFTLLFQLQSFFIFVFSILFVITPFGLLILLEYCYHLFDQSMNKDYYKTIYKKGIHHE